MLKSKLIIFQITAEKLSFTKAAEVLYMTQPAVTKHIHKLEEQLQMKLFERSGNKIALTDAGQILLTYARQIDQLYNQAVHALGQLKNLHLGQLKIGASTTMTQYVLPRIIQKFTQRYPDLKILVLNGNTEQIEHNLLQGKIDLGIIEGQHKRKGIQYQTFLKDDIVLACRPGILPKSKIGLRELTKYPLIIRESGSGTREVIEHYCKQKQYKLSDFNIMMEYGSTQGIKNYLLQSDALAFLSRQSILDELKRKELTIIEISDFEIPRYFNFIYPEGQQNAQTKLFMRFAGKLV